jgi:hypothetical protein
MKFLLFNVVVAGALIFLFAGDRADPTTSVGAAVAALTDNTPDVSSAAEPAPVAAPKPAVPAAGPAALPAEENPEAEAAVPVTEPANGRVASASPPTAPDLPPEVAERRKEVLGDPLPNEKGAEKIIEVDPNKFMSPEQRRRDLILLSEEMELFSAETLGR